MYAVTASRPDYRRGTKYWVNRASQILQTGFFKSYIIFSEQFWNNGWPDCWLKQPAEGLYLTLSHLSIRPLEWSTKGIETFYILILIYFIMLDIIRLSKYSNLTFYFYFHCTFKNNFPDFVKRLKFFCNPQVISIPPWLRVTQFVKSVIIATIFEWQNHCKFCRSMANE